MLEEVDDEHLTGEDPEMKRRDIERQITEE